MSNFPQPYLSLVVAGRNDNYGGDFHQRIQNQVTWIARLAEEYQLPMEYILVNYNPVTENPPLRQSLNWPANRKFLQFRILTVSQEIHQTFVNPTLRKTVPLFEFVAKNAGIRRANGTFILTTNADILFDPALIQLLARQNLDTRRLYRAYRCDYWDSASPPTENTAHFFAQIQAKVFKFFMSGIHYEWKNGPGFNTKFGLLKALHPLRVLSWKLENGIRKGINALGGKLRLITEDNFLPCIASGDFMLMDREKYHQLRGFPEDTLISTHTDSLMVFKAKWAGLTPKILDSPVYHQEHARRFVLDGAMSPEIAAMQQRLFTSIDQMQKLRKPLITNGEAWGMAGVELEEEIF